MKTPNIFDDEITKAAIERGDLIIMPNGDLAVSTAFRLYMYEVIQKGQDNEIKGLKKENERLKKHLNLFVCNPN